jgi:hypothetical protein
MAQAALPFDAQPSTSHALPPSSATGVATQSAADPVAFAIGWDHARHLLTPPVAHLHMDSPVHQGWLAGRAVFARRTLSATPQVRHWLQLRLDAWLAGRVFEDVQVTPHHLAQLAASHCPVMRCGLTSGTQSDTDGAVTPINPNAACAAGNLAMLSRAAESAKARLDWSEAMDRARALDEARASSPSGSAPLELAGLNAGQWNRLGVLMSFVTPLPHATAATIPLRVLPPNRLRVLNAVQALQVMLTCQFTRAGYARRLVALAVLMPSSETRQAFQVFMHTLLARRLEVGHALDEAAMRLAMEDTWADPLVNRRWQRLALRLTEAQCEQLLLRAAQRGLAGGNTQWMSAEQATEGWALDTSGYSADALPTDAGHSAGDVLVPMPGRLRSLGSQKLANCDELTTTAAFQ